MNGALKFVAFCFITISFISCGGVSKRNEDTNATKIISDYYKNKYIDKSIVLDEKHRIVLDTIVSRLTETKEPDAIIQYIVNDYKLKYGTK